MKIIRNKMISVLTAIMFISNCLPVAGAEYQKNGINTLSASLRTKPLAVVTWDSERDEYVFEDNKELQKEFMEDAAIAYIGIALKDFLTFKNKAGTELKMEPEGIAGRFDKFKRDLNEYKDLISLDFSNFEIIDPEGELEMTLQGDTVWLPYRNDEKEIYMFCFYLSEKSRDVPQAYLSFDDSGSNKKVVCEMLGPFENDLYSKDEIAVASRPEKVIDVMNFSFFNFGSELELKWRKDINTRCVSEFYKNLPGTRKNKDNMYINNDPYDNGLFLRLMINIIISTLEIDSHFMRRAFIEMYFASDSTEKKQDYQKMFVAAWYVYFRKFYSKENVFKPVSEISSILSEIENEFKAENIDMSWLNDFSGRMDGYTLKEFEEVFIDEDLDDVALKAEEIISEDSYETENPEDLDAEEVEKDKQYLNDLLREMENAIETFLKKLTPQTWHALREIDEKIGKIFEKYIEYERSEQIEQAAVKYVRIISQPKYLGKNKYNRNLDEKFYFHDTMFSAASIMYVLQANDAAKTLFKRLFTRLDATANVLKKRKNVKESDFDSLGLKKARIYAVLVKIYAREYNISAMLENAGFAMDIYQEGLRSNRPKTREYLSEVMRTLFLIRSTLVSFGEWAQVERCNGLLDKLYFPGNCSAEERDKNDFINESRMRMDLNLRIRDGHRGKAANEEFNRNLRRSTLFESEENDGYKVILAWKYFLEDRVEDAAKIAEEFGAEHVFLNEEKETYLRLCRGLFLHYFNIKDTERAEKFKKMFFLIRGKDNTDRDKALSEILNISEPDSGGYSIKNERTFEEYHDIDTVRLMILMDLAMRSIGLEKDLSVFTDWTDTSGGSDELVKIISDILRYGNTFIDLELMWYPRENRERFIDIFKKYLDESSENVAIDIQVKIIKFINYMYPDNAGKMYYYQKLEKLKYEAEAEVNVIKNSKGKKRAFIKKVEKLIDETGEIMSEISKEISAGEWVDLIKRSITSGEFNLAAQKIKTAQKAAIRSNDEDALSDIELLEEMLSLVKKAEEDFKEQNFREAWINMSNVGDLFEDLEISPGGKFDEFSGKCVILARAQDRYENKEFDGALDIAKKVEDPIAGEFIEKVKIVRSLDVSSAGDKAFKTIEKIYKKCPQDILVEDLYLGIKEAVEAKKTSDQIIKEGFKKIKKTLIDAVGKDKSGAYSMVIDDIRNMVSGSDGYSDRINETVVWVVNRAKKDGHFSDAIVLLDLILGMDIEGKRKKQAEDLKMSVFNALNIKKQKATKEKIEKSIQKIKNIIKKDDISAKDVDVIIKIFVEDIPPGAEKVTDLVKKVASRLFESKEYAQVIYFVNATVFLLKNDIKARSFALDLSKKSSSWISVNRIKKHFDIIDCQVKAENLITEKARESLRKKSGKTPGLNIEERLFDEIEVVDYVDPKTRVESKKIKISKIYFKPDNEKEKKQYISDFKEVLVAQMGESFSMNCNMPEGGKIQLFIEPFEISKDHILFDLINSDEADILRSIKYGMTGVMRKISDPSLLKRRILLRNIINNLISSLNDDKETFSTNYKIIDVLLGICKGKKYYPDERPVDFKDEFLEQDVSQNRAVRSGIGENIPVSIIQGSPGTGKSRVTIELIRQFYEQGKKVLVVSQSNPGIDVLAKRLIELQQAGDDITFARVGSELSDIDQDENIQENWNNSTDILGKMYSFGKGKIVLGTTNGFFSVVKSVKNPKQKDFYSGEYDVVIIEEAGRATLAETLLPVSVLRNDGKGKAVLVGDHKQLPAYGIDQKTIEFIKDQLVFEKTSPDKIKEEMDRISRITNIRRINDYKRSLFEDLWESKSVKGVEKTFLKRNRRSLWPIARLVSEIFYDGEVSYGEKDLSGVKEDTVDIIDYTAAIPLDERVEFDGEDQEGSSFNLKEAEITVEEYFKKLNIKENKSFIYLPGDISIVTPYKAQINMLNCMLNAIAIINDLKEDRDDVPEDINERIDVLKKLAAYRSKGTGTYVRHMNYTALNSVISSFYNDYADSDFRKEAYNKLIEIFDLRFIDGYDLRNISYHRDMAGRVSLFGSVSDIVRTIDSMQGAENKVVILSLVRSNDSRNIGFMGKWDGMQRLNVAISRAQEKLTMIGDFSHTLTKADYMRSGKINRNILRSREALKKMVRIVDNFKTEYHKYAGNKRKDIGGGKSDNEKVVNPLIRDLIRGGKIIKAKFGPDKKFYCPRYIEKYDVTIDDTGNSVKPVFSGTEMNRISSIINRYLENDPKNVNHVKLKDITLGIIKDSFFVSSGSGDKFSIVHAGESTYTIYLGELFLKELLKPERTEDLDEVFRHEAEHILDPGKAAVEHLKETYKSMVKRMDLECEALQGKYQARKMLELMKWAAYKLSKNTKKLVIGLDTDWLPYKEGIQPLIDKGLQEISGKYNIVFIKDRGESLARRLKEFSDGSDFSNMIILGSGDTLENPEFNIFRDKENDKKAWFFEIDPRDIVNSSTGIDENNYIRIIEMLRAALIIRLKEYKDIDRVKIEFPSILISVSPEDPHYFTMIPLAKPYNYEDMKKIYEAELAVILSA